MLERLTWPPHPPPEAVLAAGAAALRRHLPPSASLVRQGRSLVVLLRGQRHVWDLDVVLARFSVSGEDWRDTVEALAEALALQLTAAVRAEDLRPLLLSLDEADELSHQGVPCGTLAPGLALALATTSRLEVRTVERHDLMHLHLTWDDAVARAVENVRLSARGLALAPLGDSLVLTNHAPHPFAATALADLELLQGLREAAGSDLLLAAPDRARLFVAPDRPGFDAALARLLQAAMRVEEHVLSPFVYRFDGSPLQLATVV